MTTHCPFHDSGERFSCHLSTHSEPQYKLLIPHTPGPRLDACKVLAGRTLVLLGDSLTAQLYHTLRCHLCHGPICSPRLMGLNRSLFDERQATYTEPECADFGACGSVCFLESGTTRTVSSLNTTAALLSVLMRVATRPAPGCNPNCKLNYSSPLGLDSSNNAARELLIVVNDGIWYTGGDSWGTALTRALERASKLGAVWKWAKTRASHNACLLWRETGPQHFAGRSAVGTFRHMRSAKGTSACVPHRGTFKSPWEPVHFVLRSFGIPVIRVWNSSRQHWDKHVANRTAHMLMRGHHGALDCTHWCTPGVVDAWAALLFQALQKHCPGPHARNLSLHYSHVH